MKYPDSLPALRKAKKEETRKKIQFAFDNRCVEENLPLLKDIICFRQELAQILDFQDYPSYVLDIKMAKTKSRVEDFENKIWSKLLPLGQKELEKLLYLKEQEKKSRNENFDGKINEWDFSYYINMLKENEYGVDDETVRQYFPMETTLIKMFNIFETILGLRFEEKKTENIWHSEVKFFEVFNSSTNIFMGTFYLDLFPREGKYSHASAYPVLDGCMINGEWKLPVAVMVANFSRPTANKPSLLTHKEIITLFHEFGHVCHSLCSKAQYSRGTWFHVEMDFVEAPSQMLENWCWQKEILKKLSGNFENPTEPLPEELIDNIIRSKNVCVALSKLRQISLGMFDLEIHQAKITAPEDLSSIYAKLKKKISLVEPSLNTNFPASFLHLCAGYDCGYYGYLWSEVFSEDMFSRFKNEGLLNIEVGRDYRQKILQQGASKDAIQLLQDFLGREPTEEAFLASIGIF